MMNKVKKIVVIATVFILAFMFHVLYFKLKLTKEPCGSIVWFQEYMKGQEYFLGFSYALSFAFIGFAFFKFKENKKNALKAAMGGGLFAIMLWVFCFLFGCCGSPMVIVYLNLLGLSSLKIPKVFLFLMTIVFIVIGYIWITRKRPENCCGGVPCGKSDK